MAKSMAIPPEERENYPLIRIDRHDRCGVQPEDEGHRRCGLSPGHSGVHVSFNHSWSKPRESAIPAYYWVRG